MGQLVVGGTSGISIGSLSLQLEGVARQYKMVVPPYFALVLRAFSVIEGIAMQHNPDYRIVSSCFPYLSQRLLTDDHPRMQAALKKLLCGEGERLDVQRLQNLIEAFGVFTAANMSPSARISVVESQSNSSQGNVGIASWGRKDDVVVDAGMRKVLVAVFARKGTFVQVSHHDLYTMPCVVYESLQMTASYSRAN
jgi:aarF domain-containing kinase